MNFYGVVMSYSELTQRIIRDIYKGDVEAYKRADKRAKADTIQWDDIALNATLYPEHETTVQNVIRTVLGFNPSEQFILPHESFIRVAVNQHLNNEMSLEQLYVEAEYHLKHVRNVIYQDHLEIYNDRGLYESYYASLLQVSAQAKERLARSLGYQPALETSVYAEILLREALSDPKNSFDDRLDTVDLQALTLIKLREVLLSEGLEAALASPLPARDLVAAHILRRTAREKKC